MNVPWTHKYRPQTISEVVGNDQAKEKIIKWIQQWERKPPKKKALFLYGPPGTGKTITVEALGNELELVQSNASNQRTAKEVQRFAGIASQYSTLSGKKRIILLDEIDGLTGTADRGGLRVITDIIKSSALPIILTANNAYDRKFQTLRKYCQLIKFTELTETQITRYLKRICIKEDIKADEEALRLIAKRARGDARSAVNDLQALAQGKSRLTRNDVAWMTLRDRKEVIFNALRNIFYAKDLIEARKAADLVDIDLDMLLEWIYENLPYHVKNPSELAATMEMLALADVYRGRIRATQNWTLMRYYIDFITAGIAASWSRRATGWFPFKFPSRIISMSRSRTDRAMQTAIGMKIRKQCHVSSTRAKKEIIPYLRVIFQDNAEMRNGLAQWLNLDEDMTEYLSAKR